VHLESFSIQKIMRGAPPTPAASRPQSSSSTAFGAFAASESTSDAGVRITSPGGRSEAVFTAEPPENYDAMVRDC
jgi:hypothetical protein